MDRAEHLTMHIICISARSSAFLDFVYAVDYNKNFQTIPEDPSTPQETVKAHLEHTQDGLLVNDLAA